jgi:hypothetical protein
MTIPPPACMTCVHYDRAKPLTCDAFSDRIPDVIWLEGDPHTSHIEGDHGIQYEPNADAEEDDDA